MYKLHNQYLVVFEYFIYFVYFVYQCNSQWRRKGTTNPKSISPNVPYENCSHFWDCFDFWGVDLFDFGGSKNIFNLCSHIQLNTQNPNPISKIAICFTNTPNMPKYFRNFGKCSKIENVQQNQNIFCFMYK